VDVGFGAAWLDREALPAAGRPVRWHLGDLAEALARQPSGSLDAISVSIVADWLDDGAVRALACVIARAAAPGARVLVRHLVRPPGPDPYVGVGLVRDPVSADLPSRDRTALYESIDLYRMPFGQTIPAK
jgi:S-adenosylmethionine-diacylglycerol 3-amino-3-carboxypropyl transferase